MAEAVPVLQTNIFTNMRTMKKYLLLILTIPFLFSSCADDEPSPEARIAGTYESVTQGNLGWGTEKFDFVGTLEFKSDGTYTFEEVTKNIGEDEVLGYRAYGNGSYTIEGNQVTIITEESFILGVADLNYLPKSDLVAYQFDSPPFAKYEITEDFKKLTNGCGPLENCIWLIYNRVE